MKIEGIIPDILEGISDLYIAINDVKSHISDRNSSICNNLKTNNSALSQIHSSNNDNSFGNKLNEQSAIIQELTDKYSKFNMDEIIETKMKQAVNIIKEDYKKILNDIANSFTEVKTYTNAFKKHFDTSQQEVSKLTMKLNQVTSDNTRQTELWEELTHKEDMYKIEVIN
ncbi:hypothetical protein O181_118816 [Austropuccinia psidii MF-1]|uniref:Uncharacterized protein n=1 Tax=Austropuccinia psidii MF-1 TaxID=1389203 RepID=A0A9Q3KFB0_9BASI|nr:hypothetical protein [Austropuccinia psidii MF-1]